MKTRKSIVRGAAVLFVLTLALSTCNMPMGLGPPIDWEPPVLTLDGPTNRYVRYGTTLTGTITDNGKVDRVILRDTVTDEILFTAKLLPNDRWEIELNFDDSRNGDKILGELVGYDSFGNSGDTSIKGITLNVDLRPPFVEDIWISRTEIRKAFLESLEYLQDLERTDPKGEWLSEVNKYQNGNFWIDARIAELETTIRDIKLFIYDERYPDTPIYPDGIVKLDNSTVYNPRFLLKEADILADAERIWPGYTAGYNNGERHYYRVEIIAEDMAANRNFPLVDQLDYFCMWKTADMPKGILDPIVGTTDPITIPKGSPLPVQFFDDDTLDFAYAVLFTQDQWNGTGENGYIDDDVCIPSGAIQNKFNFLTERLLANDPVNSPVYNWRYGKYKEKIDNTTSTPKSNNTINLIPPGGIDDIPYYVEVGNSDNDYGDYVLFTLVGDKKLTPHNTSDKTLNLINARIWNIKVVDENAPLIIFKVTKDENVPNDVACPEENTFPELNEGRYFYIKGYTLRENNSGMNHVTKFRMAWIPFGLPGGADSYIQGVRTALSSNLTASDTAYLDLHGIQWWSFDEEDAFKFRPPEGGEYNEPIGGIDYRQQPFNKRFDVQGGPDLLPNGITNHATYKNFTYNGVLENTTKLFIFYAVDNMGHEVFSQRYLLGNRIPPTLQVYDITGKPDFTDNVPPNIYYYTSGTITDEVRRTYQRALDTYNKENETTREIIEGVVTGLTTGDLAATLQAYPRNTIISYFVTAGEAEGGLEVKDIKMEDVTSQISNENGRLVGYYPENHPEEGLSYTELLPEVDQRTFRFTATDALGNTNSIQRTVVISAAALLTEITTKTPTGKYGITTEIVLQARFSGQVKWVGTNPPLLNVRYINTINNVNQLRVVQIPTRTPANFDTQFLEFPITVYENDGGTLHTMFKGIEGTNSESIDRPLTLPSGTQIYDADREDYPAFIPGYAVGFDWLDPKGSLQSTKTITLDGIRPRINGAITISGNPYETEGTTPIRYFKRNETIEFTLPNADKNIFTSGNGNPRLEFNVGTPNTSFFADWQRSAGNGRSMVFSATVAQNWLDGEIRNVRLNTASGTIVDDVGNQLMTLFNNNQVTVLTLNGTVRIDQTAPAVPTPITIRGNTPSTTATNNYNGNPLLMVSTTVPANELWGIDRTEYSLNNGLEWVRWPTPRTGWTATGEGGGLTINGGEWILRTRHIDKAGNEGVATTHTLSVNSTFPRVVSISAAEPNGRYTTGNLNFTLSFSAPVWTETPTNVTITLANRSTNNTDIIGIPGVVSPTYQQTLRATTVAGSAATATTSVSFAWTGITGKEMLNGLYVSNVAFTALKDVYGNDGPSANVGTANNFRFTVGGADCVNLSADLIVDCLVPTLSSTTPVSAQGRTNNDRASSVMSAANNVITLTFREPVQRGSGTITIKPHGAYFIPPVFENDTYYLRVSDGARRSTPSTGYTKIAGFYDIYNNSALIATDRSALTAGTNMTTGLTLDERTGQAAGPYIRMTQGLKQGAGYSGNYNNNMNTDEFRLATVANANGANVNNIPVGPNTTGTTYMVPDTATKWVLDYRYSINNGTNINYVNTSNASTASSPTAVGAIRAVLTKAKYRWQEVDVTNTSIVTINGSTVTITLSEPLEKGLEWDICYPYGTFRDLAGNNANGINYSDNTTTNSTIVGENGDNWFLSSGVHTPVIRVNRKSFDARTTGWSTPIERNNNNANRYAVPANLNIPGGWGIGDFNTVHFRIETETPYATLSYGKIDGRTVLGTNNIPVGSAYIVQNADTAWTGAVPDGGTAGNTTAFNWNAAGTAYTNGTWVRPNLIRRAGVTGANNFWAVVENGITSLRLLQSTNSNHYGFRSYNRDATYANITALGLGTNITGAVSTGTDNFTYYPTEARKDYVVAQATVNYGSGNITSDRGYEGVFRSVVALYQQNATLSLVVEGSNVKNGMPAVPGFPVQDAEETGDARFVKLFYREGDSSRFYWVSTEIVTPWYFIKFGNGGSHQSSGEVNNYLSAGYGDLTYGYQVGTYNY